MFISVFEMFKVGIGPSSSHTMGPMLAAGRFLRELGEAGAHAARVTVRLHGSLAFTGRGHKTDQAVCLGLLGREAETIDPDRIEDDMRALAQTRTIRAEGLGELAFDPASDILFETREPLPAHPNGMVFSALDAEGGVVFARTYYSIGGGFVVDESELLQPRDADAVSDVPYPFRNAAEMLEMGEKSGLSVARMKRANECTRMSEADLDRGLAHIWSVMGEAIERGLHHPGILPGGLDVRRRAPELYSQLEADRLKASGNLVSPTDLLIAYAMAVNEENAAGGRIVTAPTNGAAGIIPAVLRIHAELDQHATRETIHDFLLTAAAIGGIIKKNASISGAELGCQGEVGSAAAMAAGAFCAARGGTNAQIENAAEIALEHNLGLTCDPVNGLVQVPCIERNGMAAVKARAAAMLALRGDGRHYMPLDNCIEAMRQTGLDMSDKYKETSRGGLSVNLPAC